MEIVKGKVAFVTGGSSGIGLGIARAFVNAGMNVGLGYRTKEHLDEAMEYLQTARERVHPIYVDVADRTAMENAATETVNAFGRVHVLVNNAGVQNNSTLSQMSYEDWDRLMRVNLDGVFNGIHTFLPRIERHGEGGQIITTASILGLFTVGAHYGAYSASKFAVISMMEALRADLLPSNIGVSALCPGPVKSNLEAGLKDFALASDPLDVGEQVLQGMRDNRLYILTHPEFNSVVRARCKLILESKPGDLHPGKARAALAQQLLQDSIYIHEKHGCL